MTPMRAPLRPALRRFWRIGLSARA
jgi:hypothetical protein